MSVSCKCCVLSGRGLCDGPIPRPEESYCVCVCVCVFDCDQLQQLLVQYVLKVRTLCNYSDNVEEVRLRRGEIKINTVYRQIDLCNKQRKL